jgi:hypothetical protein
LPAGSVIGALMTAARAKPGIPVLMAGAAISESAARSPRS